MCHSDIQHFNPNDADVVREKFARGEQLAADDICILLTAIEFWRAGLNTEHKLTIELLNERSRMWGSLKGIKDTGEKTT